MPEAVAVTGMGVLTAAGEGLAEFTAALRAGRCGVTGNQPDGLRVAATLAARSLDERLAALALPLKLRDRARQAGRHAARPVQATLVAALEAWQAAGLDFSGYPPEGIHLIIAGHNLGQRQQYQMQEKHRANPEYVPARHALQYMDSDHLGVVSEALAITGEGFTIGAASASGNAALLQGYRKVGSGECSVCVVVGAMAELSPVEIQAFRNTGAMGGRRFAEEPERASRPFDADREGFILGEGAACLVLEPAAAAKKRGGPRWGELAGGAAGLDGNHLADPSLAGEVRVMRAALAAAGVGPEAVDYVNAHGTGSVLGDEVEAAALRAVFGDRANGPWINATKGITGHCLSAAAVVEAVAVLLQLKHGFLHPNRNLERPIDSALRFVGSTSRSQVCQFALSNAFGFGGINTALAFKS
jgi:malonyl-ACP decarboxylase